MSSLRPGLADPAAPRLPAALTIPDEAPEHLDGVFQLELLGADYTGLDLAEAEIEQCRLGKVLLAGAQARGTTLVDCAVENSDLANAVFESAGWRRVKIAGSRLTGLSFINGHVRDVVFRESKMDLTNWRATVFMSVHFVGCDLTRADFAGADLRGVHFTDCTLTAAQFSNAKLTGARFAGCELSGVGGVESMSGCTVRADDLSPLVDLMAKALGITIEQA